MTAPVVIYTDGACKGNPGPGGWGALLQYGGTERELFGGTYANTGYPPTEALVANPHASHLAERPPRRKPRIGQTICSTWWKKLRSSAARNSYGPSN